MKDAIHTLHKVVRTVQGVHEKRAQAFASRVRWAMECIDREAAQNDGAYPSNGGKVTLDEVARRAEVHTSTFWSSRHLSLRQELDSWLARRRG